MAEALRGLLLVHVHQLVVEFFLHPFFMEFKAADIAGVYNLLAGDGLTAVFHNDVCSSQLHGSVGVIRMALSHNRSLLLNSML